MDRFVAREGQFWLDGEPQLIQAGEFHYFRTPADQWPHRLGLLKEAGFGSVAAYIPWRWHQLEEGLSDLDGHSHPMRDLAGFLDRAADMGFLIMARPGPYIMAETINEGIPDWVFERYPQVAWMDQDGKAQNIVSYLHPDFLRCVETWYRAVFEVLTPRQITRGGQIILIQLDNEMGMMPWVRNLMDTNPDTMARFAAYLEESYGQHLGGRYPTDRLADLLAEGILHPQEPCGTQIVEDYRQFYRGYLREYASFLWSAARAEGMEVPPVANIHGFANGGKTFPIGLSQLVDVMGIEGMISATDVYPIYIGEGNFHQLLLVNEMTKALQNEDQPLFSIEFQSGGNHDFGGNQTSMYDLHSRLCISTGMRAINHYLFFGGENDPLLSPVKRHDWGPPVRPDGTVRKHYPRYVKLSRVLASYGRDLVVSEPQTVTTIGFLLDAFMTEVDNELTREATKILTHQREVILFDMIARGLALTHRPFRAIDLDRSELDVGTTPVCWAMMETHCSAETQEKLVAYVQRGGRLILAGRMCIKDFCHRPCTTLRDATGITQIDRDPPFTGRLISAFDHRDVPVSFLETYTGSFDQVFATSESGEAVGFTKRLGAGQVMVFGAAMTANTLSDLDIVHQMALMMDGPSLFRLSDWADVRLSRGANGSFLYANNYQDDPVETTMACEATPLFGGNPVHLPARRGLILPLDWQARQGVTVHYLTAEIVAIEDEGSAITIRTEPQAFVAELSLTGYDCLHPAAFDRSATTGRMTLRGKDGVIKLARTS